MMVPRHAHHVQEHAVYSIQRYLHESFFAGAIPNRKTQKTAADGNQILQNARVTRALMQLDRMKTHAQSLLV
jgi:hypothetical protein